jgi:hypothetical protein
MQISNGKTCETECYLITTNDTKGDKIEKKIRGNYRSGR